MKAWSGSEKTGYLGFGCQLWPYEKKLGWEMQQVEEEGGNLYHLPVGGAVSSLDGCVFG